MTLQIFSRNVSAPLFLGFRLATFIICKALNVYGGAILCG